MHFAAKTYYEYDGSFTINCFFPCSDPEQQIWLINEDRCRNKTPYLVLPSNMTEGKYSGLLVWGKQHEFGFKAIDSLLFFFLISLIMNRLFVKYFLGGAFMHPFFWLGISLH